MHGASPQLDDQQPIWFSKSKTRPPEIDSDSVERHRLLSELDASLDNPVTYVTAPAGYGKSVLLAQWRSRLVGSGVTCAWLTLDESDREIRLLFAYLVLALVEAGVDMEDMRAGAEHGFANMPDTAIGTELLARIEEIPEKAVLILDDFHRAESDDVSTFINALQLQCADRLKLVLASRQPFGSDASTQITVGKATEIQAVQLCFTDDEVCSALRGAIDDELLSELQGKVEGWPVAVQMTKLLGEQRGNLQSAITSIRGDHGHMATYLVSEIMDGLPNDLRAFVLNTAVLDSFNVELANAVCGDSEAHRLIKRLNVLSALVVPMDGEREWFRYHHLVSECICKLLETNDKEQFEKIHRVAAQWCGDNGFVAEAVNYANRIEDFELSRRVINDNGGWAIALAYSTGYLRNLFAEIPEAEVQKDALLMLDKAYIHLRSGELKQALTYCRQVEIGFDPKQCDSRVNNKRLAICSSIFGRSEASIEYGENFLERRLAEVPKTAHFTRAFVEIALANEKIVFGDFALSRAYAEAAVKSIERTGNRIMMGAIHMSIATGAAYRGQYSMALPHFREAAGLTSEICGGQNRTKFLSGVGMHAIGYWQGRTRGDGPEELKKELLSILDADGGFDDYAVGFDALVHHAISTGEFADAQVWINMLNQANERYGFDRLTRFGQALQLNLLVGESRLAEAETYHDKVSVWHGSGDQFWFLDIMGGFARARFLAATNRSAEAIDVVDEALNVSNFIDTQPFTIRGLVLKAELLEAVGQHELAAGAFIASLELASAINMEAAFTGAEGALRSLDTVDRELLDEKLSLPAKALLKKVSRYKDGEILTDREKEVLIELSHGDTNKQIARKLGLTENTIKYHVKGLYRKLDVSKRVKAVEKGRSMGIIS